MPDEQFAPVENPEVAVQRALMEANTEMAFRALREELYNARNKFPTNAHLLAALAEEVGELAKALLENHRPDRIREEAIQVACVAIRIATEGDADFRHQGDSEAEGE